MEKLNMLLMHLENEEEASRLEENLKCFADYVFAIYGKEVCVPLEKCRKKKMEKAPTIKP